MREVNTKIEKKFKWHNLPKNKCPACGADLLKAEYTDKLIICNCNFKIGRNRFKDLVDEIVNKTNYASHYN